ncbi:hypothetical protein E2C01_023941 [Portunus trituberculatus]|uniref:Uncharacterized protein n=1 Tax=Portunus trituberculatus TaxID=210409 RepID=A0A5B7ECJ0_PORTR|nr:hypothetical protein [Portunus trituberculatus]
MARAVHFRQLIRVGRNKQPRGTPAQSLPNPLGYASNSLFPRMLLLRTLMSTQHAIPRRPTAPPPFAIRRVNMQDGQNDSTVLRESHHVDHL